MLDTVASSKVLDLLGTLTTRWWGRVVQGVTMLGQKLGLAQPTVFIHIYIAVAQFAFGARTVSVVFFFSGGSFMVGIDNQTLRQKMCEHSEGMDGIERTETTSAAVSRNPTSVEAGPSHCQTYPYSESCKHCDSSMFYQEHLGAFFRGYLTLTWLSRSSILPGFFLHCIG